MCSFLGGIHKLNLEIAIHENTLLRAEYAQLTVKYELLVVKCERLMDENDQLRACQESLREEIERLVAV